MWLIRINFLFLGRENQYGQLQLNKLDSISDHKTPAHCIYHLLVLALRRGPLQRVFRYNFGGEDGYTTFF